MVDAPTVLPINSFFPDKYDSSDDAARVLVDRICAYMHVSPDLVDIDFFSESNRPWLINENGHAIAGTAGLYRGGSRFQIRLERRQLANPMELVGTISHEFAHARLLGESRLSRKK